MKEQKVLRILNRVGAVITDSHIVYTSGKHGSVYVNKDALYPHTEETSHLCRALAEQFANDDVEVVIAPAIGGVILSQWIAHHLNTLGFFGCPEVLAVFAEKYSSFEIGKIFEIRRGYGQLIAGKNVLVVEDVITTGGSAKKVVEAVHRAHGNVVGLGVLVNRGGITSQDVADVPKLHALVNINLESWDEKDCSLCKQSVPINTKVGHGAEFLARKGLAK